MTVLHQHNEKTDDNYDVIVIGSGPAGQKAAVQAAKLGQRVALIERDRYLGGACVHRGTIPSKTLRENAMRISHLRANAKLAQSNFALTDNFEMSILIDRLDDVLMAHDQFMERQIKRNHIERIHGRAAFVDEHWDGQCVVTEIEGQEPIKSEKLLCAAGRLANVGDLALDKAGLSLNERGLISVDDKLQTQVPSIFAAGDVIGPPALASTSMEQGRRASCNALGKAVGDMGSLIPTGIYGIPELSAVGLNEKSAREQYGDIMIGKAVFEEIARGQISGIQDGMLKIICDGEGKKVLGVMIVGEGATELIHIGQMALLANADVDIFVESIFNFPTLAEAYRVAALGIIGQRGKKADSF